MARIIGFAGGAFLNVNQGDSSALSQEPRSLFFARPGTIYGDRQADEYRFFDSLVKDPETQHRVSLDLYRIIARQWRPNQYYDPSDAVRPLIENGFAMRITKAGTTGSRPPRVPAKVGEPVADGSAIWEVTEADQDSLHEIGSINTDVLPAGLDLLNGALVDGRYIWITYSGGQLDTDYDAKFSLTVGGLNLVFRQKVMVREQ